jgi:hypothetical protein
LARRSSSPGSINPSWSVTGYSIRRSTCCFVGMVKKINRGIKRGINGLVCLFLSRAQITYDIKLELKNLSQEPFSSAGQTKSIKNKARGPAPACLCFDGRTAPNRSRHPERSRISCQNSTRPIREMTWFVNLDPICCSTDCLNTISSKFRVLLLSSCGRCQLRCCCLRRFFSSSARSPKAPIGDFSAVDC